MRKILLLIFIPFLVHANEDGIFSARISKVSEEASLLRIKVDFKNAKYLNKKDKVEFWTSVNPGRRCKGYIVGRSTEYLLIKIPDFRLCQMLTFIDHGAHIFLFSQDLINNIKMGKEVTSILNKKRVALQGQMETLRKKLESYLDKVDSINERYEVLRTKLLQEWKKELSFIEEDRLIALRNYKGTQIRLDEVSQKLERYRIEDENLIEDKWALDSMQYIKK
ncbi:MAG: hypothetical protein ACO20H_06740 [Bacteriovoracaceae bacterium]